MAAAIALAICITEQERFSPLCDFALLCAGVATLGLALTRRIAPVEEAYRLGYEAGHRDGRRGHSIAPVVPLPVRDRAN